jgi:hypothetical protein
LARTNASKRKDEAIIAALLSTPTVKAAAVKAGIGETQLRARLRDPEFNEKYKTARRELLQESTNALQTHLQTAVQVLYDVMTDTEASQQTRVNAAEAVIRNNLKMTEQTDILTRLDELERLAK